jgi:putative transposase
MDRLAAPLEIITISKSQVSEMVKELDAHVEEFRTRRLEDTARSPSWPTPWSSGP